MSEDRQADIHIVAGGVGVRAGLVCAFHQPLGVLARTARQADGEVGGDAEAASARGPMPTVAVTVIRNLELQPAGDRLHRDEAGGIA